MKPAALPHPYWFFHIPSFCKVLATEKILIILLKTYDTYNHFGHHVCLTIYNLDSNMFSTYLAVYNKHVDSNAGK